MINPKQICKAKPEHVEFYTLSITNADINRIPIPVNDSTKFSSSFVEMFSFVIIFFLLEVVPYSSLSRIKPAKDGVLALFEERKSFLLLYKWSCILAGSIDIILLDMNLHVYDAD